MVSIHTLAWRVTDPVQRKEIIKQVSIHTLAWRVTEISIEMLRSMMENLPVISTNLALVAGWMAINGN